MPSGNGDQPLGRERLRERLGRSERLGDVERFLAPLACPLEIAGQRVPAREIGHQHREVLVGLIRRDHGESAFHALERLVELAPDRLHRGEHGRDTGGSMSVTLGLVERDRLLEQPGGRLGVGGIPGE